MTVKQQTSNPENGLEGIFAEFAQACLKNPSLDQATRALRESVFAAAEAAPSRVRGLKPRHDDA